MESAVRKCLEISERCVNACDQMVIRQVTLTRRYGLQCFLEEHTLKMLGIAGFEEIQYKTTALLDEQVLSYARIRMLNNPFCSRSACKT